MDRDALGRDRRLRQETDLPGEGLGTHPRDLPAVQQHAPRAWWQHLAQRPEQGRLAAGVGADDDTEGSRLDGDVKPCHDIAATGITEMKAPALQHEEPGFAAAQAETALTICSRTTRAAVGPAFRKNGSSSTLTACPAPTALSDSHSACPVSSSSLPPCTA